MPGAKPRVFLAWHQVSDPESCFQESTQSERLLPETTLLCMVGCQGAARGQPHETARGQSEDSKRIARGMPEDSQRIARGQQEDRNRIATGQLEDSQRIARGLQDRNRRTVRSEDTQRSTVTAQSEDS